MTVRKDILKHSFLIQRSEVLLMKTKTIKTPSMGLPLILSICGKCYGSVIKSTLLRQSHTTRHDHYSGLIPQKEKPIKPMAEAKLVWIYFPLCSLFSWFCLDEKESLKGITVFGGRLSGCLHTSRLTTKGVNTLTRVSFAARGFKGFC